MRDRPTPWGAPLGGALALGLQVWRGSGQKCSPHPKGRLVQPGAKGALQGSGLAIKTLALWPIKAGGARPFPGEPLGSALPNSHRDLRRDWVAAGPTSLRGSGGAILSRPCLRVWSGTASLRRVMRDPGPPEACLGLPTDVCFGGPDPGSPARARSRALQSRPGRGRVREAKGRPARRGSTRPFHRAKEPTQPAPYDPRLDPSPLSALALGPEALAPGRAALWTPGSRPGRLWAMRLLAALRQTCKVPTGLASGRQWRP